MNDVLRIWAWAFGGTTDHEIKYQLLSAYARDLHYIDRQASEELNLWLHLYEPPKTTLGDQLTINYGEEKTRI